MTELLKTDKGGSVAVLVDETWSFRDLGVDVVGPGSKVVRYDDGRSKDDTTNSVRSLTLCVLGSAPEKELVSGFTVWDVVKPATYAVFVSVGDRDGTPRLALPLDGGDGHRRYRLGRITVGH